MGAWIHNKCWSQQNKAQQNKAQHSKTKHNKNKAQQNKAQQKQSTAKHKKAQQNKAQLTNHNRSKCNKNKTQQSCVHILWSGLKLYLTTGKFELNSRYVIFKQILVIDGWGISCVKLP